MQAAKAAGAEALLITHAPNVRYLSGFTGSNGAVALAGGQAALFTDGRYTAQAKAEARGMRVVVDKKPAAVLAVEWLLQRKIKRCAFDSGQTSVAALETMRKAVPAGLRRKFFLAGRGLSGQTAPGEGRWRDRQDEARSRAGVLAVRMGTDSM